MTNIQLSCYPISWSTFYNCSARLYSKVFGMSQAFGGITQRRRHKSKTKSMLTTSFGNGCPKHLNDVVTLSRQDLT